MNYRSNGLKLCIRTIGIWQLDKKTESHSLKCTILMVKRFIQSNERRWLIS
jgi:hypothetical protein